MRLSNCGVFTMMISIFAFCTGLSRPASSVVSRPVVISARRSGTQSQVEKETRHPIWLFGAASMADCLGSGL